MNGKDLEKALLWEAPHIGEKAPEQIPEAQDFCEGYKAFLNEGKTERTPDTRNLTRRRPTSRATRSTG